MVNSVIQRREVRKDSLGQSVLQFLDLVENSRFSCLHLFKQFLFVDGKVALDDFKSLVEVFLHRLVVDEVLFELLGELGAENLEVFHLFGGFVADLHQFLVDVPAQVVRPLCVVLICVPDLFHNLLKCAILAVLDLVDFRHNVLKGIRDKHLGVPITLHALVDFNLDHLTQFVGHLLLLISRAFNLVPHSIAHFGHLSFESDLLLGARHLLLPEPSIDAPNLRVKVLLHLHDGLLASFKLRAHIGVHLVLAVSQFVGCVTVFLLSHFILHVNLVTHIFNLPLALILLRQESVDEVGHLDFKLVLHIVLDRVDHVSELVTVLKVVHLKAAEVLFVTSLLCGEELRCLLEAHHLAFNSFKHLVEEHRCCISLPVDKLIVLLTLRESLL